MTTDTPEQEAGAAALSEAFAKPVAKRKAKPRKAKEPEKKPVEEFKEKIGKRGLPELLPEDCPVKALGTREGEYYFLDSLGQIRHVPDHKISRLFILALFGGAKYLKATWPIFELDGDTGRWIARDKWDHDALGPVLIESCTEKGVWDPTNKVRGCGTWIESSGDLIMHCGEKLFRSRGKSIIVEKAGVQGDLLYPRRPPLPEPNFQVPKERFEDAGPRIFGQLEGWHWMRPEVDPRLALGWLTMSFVSQAAPWRPAIWTTGGKGTGKSTLLRLFEWIHSKEALIMPTDASSAYIYQSLGDGSLPVALDELEAKEDNRRTQDIINLMRYAASGGKVGRGGSENNPKDYILKSCFCAFSILLPPLLPQDISRMAILHLLPLKADTEEPELALASPAEYDLVLGPRDRWSSVGRRLRARVLEQWPRFLQTYQAYFYALKLAGHDPRAAAQFGSLGTGYDIAMYDELSTERAQEWAKLLPAATLAETKGYLDEPEGCLQHLLAAPADVTRGGTCETIRYYLEKAKENAEHDTRMNDSGDPGRTLARIGIAVYRDRTLVTPSKDGHEDPVWWIAISNTHPRLADIFEGTHWRGKPGAPGTWAQALRAHPAASKDAKQMHIDGQKWWVTRLMWTGVFPEFGGADDAEEMADVDPRDRVQLTVKEEAEVRIQRTGL